jgi:putative restriction endonuclease
MKHGFGYMGRYERSFDTFGPGVRTYLRADGSLGEIDEKPDGFEGIWFGFMEHSGKSFSAVRVQYGPADIFIREPVQIDAPRHADGKGFGPQTTTCGDSSAKRLLADLATANPDNAAALMDIAKHLGWDLDQATRMRSVNQEERAAKLWELLVASAASGSTTTYSDLEAQTGIYRRVQKWPLALIQEFCLDRYPPLTSIVVHAGDQRPGVGFIAWDGEDLASLQRNVFDFNWTGIVNPFRYASAGETAEHLAHRLVKDPASAGPIYQLVRVRGPAQTIFRLALLEAYGGACAFCGLTFVEALDAAHIVPWSRATPAQRLDVRNGLLLCSTHHRLFDHDWLTITDEYKIKYSDTALEDGPYTDADTAIGPSLHGASIRRPARKDLWPTQDLIRERYAEE